MKFFSDYYNDLYKSTQPEEATIHDFLKGLEIPGLANEHQQRLNMAITIADLETSIKSMKLGRTLGLDGLPIEFYRVFKEDLLPHFQQVIENCYRKREMP